METHNKQELLQKYVWQMTGEELLALQKTAVAELKNPSDEEYRICGMAALSDYLGCGETTLYELKKNGILDKAIISSIGRKYIFDGKKARELVNEYVKKRAK